MREVTFPKSGEPRLKITVSSGRQVRLVSATDPTCYVTVEAVTHITAAVAWMILGMLSLLGGLWLRSQM